MRNLADPNTGLGNFVSSLSATAAEVAPVAEIQGQLFVDLDTTFGGLRARFAPIHPGVDLVVAVGRGHGDHDPADVRPLLANTAKLFTELSPGSRDRAACQKDLGNSIVEGVKALALSPAFNAQLDPPPGGPQPRQPR